MGATRTTLKFEEFKDNHMPRGAASLDARLRASIAALTAMCVACAILMVGAATVHAEPTTESDSDPNWSLKTTTRELDGTFVKWSVDFRTNEPSLSFHVEVNDGQALVNEPAYWELRSTTPTDTRLASAVAAANNYSIAYDLNTPASATVSITGAFDPDTRYEVRFRTVPANPAKPYFDRGEGVSATVTLGQLSASAINFDTSGVALEGRSQPGFGAFAVTSLVQGGAAHKMPADARFIINGTYTLPNGSTTDNYTGWVAPGTLRADKTGGTFTMTVEKDSAATLEDPTHPGQIVLFPLGTRIELRQQQPQDTWEYTWSPPMFRIQDEPITGVLLETDKTHIELVNVVQLKKNITPLIEMISAIPFVGSFIAPLLASMLGMVPSGSSTASVDLPALPLRTGSTTGVLSSSVDMPIDTPETAVVRPVHTSEMLELSGSNPIVLVLSLVVVLSAGAVLLSVIGRIRG